MSDDIDALIIEPRAVPFTPEDPATPTVGKWYWLSVTNKKHVGWEPKKDEDDEDVGIYEKVIEKVFVCVVRLGSNYAKVKSLKGSTWRIHFDDFHELCEWIPEPQRIIAGETKMHQDKVVLLMQEIREVTARLAITPGLGLPGAPIEAQSVGLVLAKGKPATEYKTALIKAEKETLPQLFEKIKEQHAEMALWMKAPLIPLEAQSKAMKPAIAAIQDRLFSVELYAGLCEEVVQIKKGEPAKLTEKIRIFQRRAYMDEECLSQYEVGGMDYKSLADFDKWLCKPAQLARLMPFPRCVLAFQIRRARKEREMVTLEDYFRIRDEEQWDKSTFLYIRNGERMYRLETTIEFDAQLFPDMRREQPNGTLFTRFVNSFDSHNSESYYDTVGENELQAIRAAEAETLKEWKKERKKIPKADRWHHNRPKATADKYKPFDHTNVYYDDIVKSIADDMTRHNRLVLVLQGILDRSEALHPHPPWSLWRQDSFEQALELLYDEVRALTPGDRPDFEAYRAKCNASIKVGSITLGQHRLWGMAEAEKENAKHQYDSHYRDRTYHYPRDNPGPGKFAHVVAVRGDRCFFQWNKPRRAKWGEDNGNVGVKFSAPTASLFHVEGYKPGDFKIFFADPRTRAEYLRWAPLLLEAEEFHAGNREVSPVVPLAPKKKNEPGGSYEYRKRKERLAWIGKAVRLIHDVTMKSKIVNKKGTLWRVYDAKKSGFYLVRIDKTGKRIHFKGNDDPTKGTDTINGASSYDFLEASEHVPPEPKEKS